MAYVFCNQCGHRNPPESSFCSSCGGVLDNVADVDEIVYTDTLPLVHGTFKNVPTSVLSVAPLIGDAMHRIHTGGLP